MPEGIVVEAGGFFTPQKKGGLSKLVLLAHTEQEEEALFALKHKKVYVNIAGGVESGGEINVSSSEPITVAEIVRAICERAFEMNRLSSLLREKMSETKVPENPGAALPFAEPIPSGEPVFTSLTKEDEAPRCLRCGSDPCVCGAGPSLGEHATCSAAPCEWCGRVPCECEGGV